MSDRSAIEWTDATWNPTRGCSRVSAGCDNCYAIRTAARFAAAGQPYAGLTQRKASGKASGYDWTGKLTIADEETLLQPLRWRKPRRIFVDSMSDLFHPALPAAIVDHVYAVAALCPQHTFQILTKRPRRAAAWYRLAMPAKTKSGRAELTTPERVGLAVLRITTDAIAQNPRAKIGRDVQLGGPHGELTTWPLPNVWLGASVENQETANERIPPLLECPAAVRFLSCEPLLGPIDLTRLQYPDGASDNLYTCVPRQPAPGESRVDWLIAGGESGPGARPCHPDWPRALREQCASAGVPFFFKQWGEWLPSLQDGNRDVPAPEWNASDDPIRVGKHRAGRLLDGRQYHEFPQPQEASP
ncbi:MAG: phage Gp37/Gp68 family protein [Pirellulales bacterium]|nr:phage Gp37/Gp68 family protein [Pirellulales bacterium]